MRLIDVDEFKNYTVSDFERNKNLFGDTEYRDFVKAIIFAVVQDLDKQSIAYDTDRVIEQLENEAANNTEFFTDDYRDDYYRGAYAAYCEAIEIVKKGGIE